MIADYKTDAVGAGPDLDARAAAYAAQGEVYARAVRDALGLDRPPRFELWFLSADRVVVPGAAPGAPPPAAAPTSPSSPPRQMDLFG